jgi:hypothetical protein
MKTKKIHRKLVLNKITIANLIGNEMRGIYGGVQKETVKNSRCITCVETDACETLEPVCPPPPSSVANSCDTLCNC